MSSRYDKQLLEALLRWTSNSTIPVDRRAYHFIANEWDHALRHQATEDQLIEHFRKLIDLGFVSIPNYQPNSLLNMFARAPLHDVALTPHLNNMQQVLCNNGKTDLGCSFYVSLYYYNNYLI